MYLLQRKCFKHFNVRWYEIQYLFDKTCYGKNSFEFSLFDLEKALLKAVSLRCNLRNDRK